jgi:hypothetical protein
VTEAGLDDPNIDLLVGKASSERVPQSVAMDALGDPCFLADPLHQVTDIAAQHWPALQCAEHAAADSKLGLAFDPELQDSPPFGINGHDAGLMAFSIAYPQDSIF